MGAMVWGMNYLTQNPSLWGGIIFLLIFCVMIVVMMKISTPRIYNVYKDWLHWRKWFKNNQGIMTCQEFCEAVTFHSWARTLSALERVRTQRKLDPTAENELFLKAFAFEIEVRQRLA